MCGKQMCDFCLIDNVVTAGFTLVLQDEEEVFFRVKRTSRLKKLMDAYCHHKSMSANSFVFLFDGSRLSGDQTPQEVPTSKSLTPLLQTSMELIRLLTILRFCFSSRWRKATPSTPSFPRPEADDRGACRSLNAVRARVFCYLRLEVIWDDCLD
jgi:hypothetical protein